MKKTSIIILISLLSTITGLAQQQKVLNVLVKVTNIKTDTGKVYLALYNNKNSFLSKTLLGKKVDIKNGVAEAAFTDLPEGEYAISVFHDENDNGKLDSNFMGIPKEPYGFSNNASGFMGPPKWEDAKILVTDTDINTIIKL